MIREKKGMLMTTELLAIIVFLVVGFILLLLIYSSVTADSPGSVNTFTNRILDALLGWMS